MGNRSTLSRKILLGLVGGIVVGLFFGEKAAVLDWPAKAFIQLLQVTVLPYLVTSLVLGIANGTADQARRLATRGGLAILVLWLVSLLLVFSSPLAFPPEKGGSFYATATVASERIDWLDLYIPANPFRSLANNIVPAVVVFSVLLGIGLLGVPGKERILQPLRLISQTLARAGSLVVSLTPIGIFAIAGHAAGTLRVEEFRRLEGFLIVSIGLYLIHTFWILPGLVSVLTGVRYRRVVSLVWDPLITSFVTANLFIVLPQLQTRAKQLLDEMALTDERAGEAVDVLVPTSFTFPHSAKLLSLTFVLFAGWFVGTPIGVSQFWLLAGAGVLSLFGSLNVAMPFLLDLMKLPEDLFQLFVVSSVVNSRFGSAAAAMHTFALAVIGASFMSERGRIDKARLLPFAAGSLLLVGGFLLGCRVLLATILPGPEDAAAAFDRLQPSGAWGRLAAVETMTDPGSRSEPPPVTGHRLEDVLRRGSLRMCVTPDAMPWCYKNSRGDIVGFDVDIAHALAVQLNVKLVLVPLPRLETRAALGNGTCDFGTGRIIPSEAGAMTFSEPLAHEMWAFLTPDHQHDVFASLDRIRELPVPRIAVLPQKEWIDQLEASLPNAKVIPVDSILDFVRAPVGTFDAMFTGFDRASAYALAYPQFAAVVPSPDLGSAPIAIGVPKGEEGLVDLANAFVAVGSANGVFAAKLDYWVRGKGAQNEKEPRWSIAHNVFGWWTR